MPEAPAASGAPIRGDGLGPGVAWLLRRPGGTRGRRNWLSVSSGGPSPLRLPPRHPTLSRPVGESTSPCPGLRTPARLTHTGITGGGGDPNPAVSDPPPLPRTAPASPG